MLSRKELEDILSTNILEHFWMKQSPWISCLWMEQLALQMLHSILGNNVFSLCVIQLQLIEVLSFVNELN